MKREIPIPTCFHHCRLKSGHQSHEKDLWSWVIDHPTKLLFTFSMHWWTEDLQELQSQKAFWEPLQEISGSARAAARVLGSHKVPQCMTGCPPARHALASCVWTNLIKREASGLLLLESTAETLRFGGRGSLHKALWKTKAHVHLDIVVRNWSFPA